MGRTLHFEVINSKEITLEEKEIMVAISDKYNEGEFKDVWTCENFYLDPWDYYPNWQFFKAIETCAPVAEPWDFIEKKYDDCKAEGMKHGEICNKLYKDRYINFHREQGENIRGFCKTGGNEYNSLLVFIALVEITTKTKAEIELHDEGELLYGDIIIKDGKCKFDIKSMKQSWAYWKKQGFLDSDEYSCRTTMENQKRLIKLYSEWFPPQMAVRPVNPEDFKDHPAYGAGQIMAGFNGEYFGLSTEDSEKQSYLFVEGLCKMLESAGIDRKNLVVAPKISM